MQVKELLGNGASDELVGCSILDLVTSGIHDDTFVLYREYLQNSADALEFNEFMNSRVDVTIEPGKRAIRIRDHGNGLTTNEAIKALIPIAKSKKTRGKNSGFRGIGRLAGLVFADQVTFITRNSDSEPVIRIIWDGIKFRSNTQKGMSPIQVISDCITIEKSKVTGYPANFFEVEILQVARHAAGTVLNSEAVLKYLSEVGPVPMSTEFSFRKNVDALFNEHGILYRTLDVYVNNEGPISRPHYTGITFSENLQDTFTDFETFIVPCADSTNVSAIGWIAHSSYIKSIPKSLGIRGLRIREGNIQIGGENVLDHIFKEPRFNRWCVGEVHVIDTRIVPNATRNYFEPSPYLRNLENHLITIASGITRRCRMASIKKNKTIRTNKAIQRWKEVYQLVNSGYLAQQNAAALVQETLTEIQEFCKDDRNKIPLNSEAKKELNELKVNLETFSGSEDKSISKLLRCDELRIYQKVCHSLLKELKSPKQVMDIITHTLNAG